MTDNRIEAKLTEQQMCALGKKLGVAHSDLSPLRVFEEKYSGLKDVTEMPPGLINEDGRLEPGIASCLETLSKARSFGAVSHVGRFMMIDTAIYYSDTSLDHGVQLTNTGDAIRLESPPDIADVLVTMSLSAGDGLLQKVDAGFDLPAEGTYVLFALIDIARERQLRGMLSEKKAPPGAVLVEDIHRAMRRKDSGMQWMAPYLAGCLSLACPESQAIAERLSGLEDSGLVKKVNSGWALTPLAEGIASELLVIDGHTRIRAAEYEERQGKGFVTDVRAIHGCSGAVLSWSHDEGSVSLMGISQAQLNDMAEEFLHPQRAEAPSEEAVSLGEPVISCAACGAQMLPWYKFCENCGAKAAVSGGDKGT